MTQKDNNTVPGDSQDSIVKWDNKYTTGIELIDTQHKELVALTNMLFRACLSGQEDSVFRETMTRMVAYVRFHFETEQQMLEGLGYPDYLNHKQQHDSMIKTILDAAKDYKEGKQFVPNKFVRALKDWIFGHIAIFDKAYAVYIAAHKEKGLLTDQQING